MQTFKGLLPIAMLPAFLWNCAEAQQFVDQKSEDHDTHARYVPVVTGGAAYVQNITGGISTLEPQINPVLLVPFSHSILLESRVEFTGIFQREDQSSGPFKGKVFKNVDYAQLDWLANSHVNIVAGKYLLPFGIYNERLAPVWIRNLQDSPITLAIGTRTTGAGDGIMFRGVAAQTSSATFEYSTYFSARSGINQIDAARTAGADGSAFFNKPRIEVGASYQRFLQSRHINNSALYVSWQPLNSGLDLKAEYDLSYSGHGYWVEPALRFDHAYVPRSLRGFQVVGRMQQSFPLNGGGNGLPQVQTSRFDAGLNYYLRDDLRLVSSYARSFTNQKNENIWNFGMTYRFMIPLWLGGSK